MSNLTPPSWPAPAVAAETSFCPTCGTAWNPLWVQCPRCAAKSKAARAAATSAGRGGGMISAMALYFTLLAASALTLAAVRYAHAGVWAIMVVQIVDSILVIAWCVYDRKDVLPPLLTSPGLPVYGVAALCAIGTFTTAMLLSNSLRILFRQPDVQSTDPFLRAGYGMWVVIVSVCVQPAIIEELAFRGVVLGGMRRVLSDNEAVLVSAGLFMVLHLSVLSFPHLFLIGVVLAVLRLKTKSLYPGMLLHFCHNLLCVIQENWHTAGFK